MARHRRQRGEEVREYEEGPADGGRAASSSASAGGSEPIIEFDPNAPRGSSGRPGLPTMRAQATADTIVPPDDFFRARDELQRRFGGLRAVTAAIATADPDISGIENIRGFGVGLRETSGSLTGDLAVKVFVREKRPLAEVAEAARIPSEVAGLPTDVEPIGEVVPASYAKQYPLRVPCGVSISHENLPGSGTLGCLVILNNNKLCLLSNNHVIANENDAQIGDVIIQPGNADPVPSPSEIGFLEDFVRIQATGNFVDAAVAWTRFDWVGPHHVTYTLDPNPAVATPLMSVLKNGRTTQATVGTVKDVGVNIQVPYKPFPGGAWMQDQIRIRGTGQLFGWHGDSGALVVTANTKQPVGLFFAVDQMGFGYANPIDAVMSGLGIKRFVAKRPGE